MLSWTQDSALGTLELFIKARVSFSLIVYQVGRRGLNTKNLFILRKIRFFYKVHIVDS